MKNIGKKQSCYLVLFVIFFDQITKILVASLMTYGNDGSIGSKSDWLRSHKKHSASDTGYFASSKCV